MGARGSLGGDELDSVSLHSHAPARWRAADYHCHMQERRTSILQQNNPPPA
jgi:hypothetical protein